MWGFSLQGFVGAGLQQPEWRADSRNTISALTAPLGLGENGLLELD